MNEIRFIKILDTVNCCLGVKNMCIASGLGDTKLEAFVDLVRMCWRYGKMTKLLKVRRIIH